MRSSDHRKILNHLDKSLERKVDLVLKEINRSIVAQTPVDTGRASRGWKYSPRFKLKRGGTIFNRVPYIGILDRGRVTIGGRAYGSLQAPDGIVVPVLKRISKRRF